MEERLSSYWTWTERSFQGWRVFLALGVLAIVFSCIGMKVRGGASFRGYVVMALISPFIVLAGMFVGACIEWLFDLFGARAAPIRPPLTILAFLLVAFVIGYRSGRWQGDTLHKRGALIAGSYDTLEATRKWQKQYPDGLTLAGIGLGTSDETKHFKMIGTTGTGKSTAIRELVGGAIRRGDRAVIADPDAGYLGSFYNPERGDVILNPFDPRAHTWNIYGELTAAHDVEQLARSLIPDQEGSDRSWRGYARTFFTALARQTNEAGVRDLNELYRLITCASTDELRILTTGTPAQPFLESGNERMFGSIRSVTGASLTALDYLAEQKGPPISVRDWVRTGRGVLFLPYQADQIAALRSIISAWLRLAIFQTMTEGEGDKKLWFVVDELDALGPIDGLKDALARLRKFGGRCVLGFQSIAQVSSTYGHGEAQTIVENCSNTLILRCSASENGGTARFASKLIGEREVIRPTVSRTRKGGFFAEPGHSVSRGEQHVTESAVLPAEIEQLRDLSGYLKFASHPAWLRVRLSPP